jgi:hypothetical protein
MHSATQQETLGREEQFALYYPYIHIRDSNWLKSTLLWFGQIRRIVPEQYTINDPPEVKTFAEPPILLASAHCCKSHASGSSQSRKLKRGFKNSWINPARQDVASCGWRSLQVSDSFQSEVSLGGCFPNR